MELDIGKRIKTARLASGLSQRGLAARTGVANATISQIESGRVNPTIAVLERIVGGLGIGLIDLLAGAGTEDPGQGIGALPLGDAIEHLSEGFALFDSEDRLVLCNSVYRDFYGYTQSDLRPGITITDLLNLDIACGVVSQEAGGIEATQNRIRRFRAAQDTFEVPLADGRWVQIRDRRTSERGTVSLHADVTERKTAEAAMRAAKEEADAANEAKSELIATVSHEVRTPMNGVLGMARLLRETALDEEQRECVETILASGESLLRIVDDLLDISKLEAGRLELESVPFIAADLVEQSVAVMAPRADEKGLTLAYKIDSKIPAVLTGDPHRLRQVLLNFISNAIKFTATGSVTVKATLKSEIDGIAVVGFSVTDTGQGIKPETRKELFSPYTQGAIEVARKYGGTGLGLSICRRLAELMESEIKLRSSVGKGSTFRLDVPLAIDRATDAADLREAAATPAVDARDESAPVRPLRILQVEDNKVNRNVAEKILARAGHHVTSVVDGAEALRAIKNGEFDVVIMDRHMPKMNGIEATKRIRKMKGPIGGIPILGVTASAIAAELDACQAAGMDGVLTKPVDGAELRVAVARLATPVKGRLKLRTDRPVLVVDDMKINLTVASKQLGKLGIPCQVADSGTAAIGMLKKGDFGAVLVDISMPKMDGLEFSRRVRKWEKTRETRIPIIAMSGYVSREDNKRFVEAGMDDFLAKPVVLEYLAATLGKWLSVPDAAEGPAPTPADGGADTPAPIDMVLLGEILGEDDEAEMLDWVGIFIEHFPPLLESLKAAVADQDPTATRDAAHAAKSAASSTGAAPLMALLRQLETDAPSAEWEGINATVATVASEFARVVEFRGDH